MLSPRRPGRARRLGARAPAARAARRPPARAARATEPARLGTPAGERARCCGTASAGRRSRVLELEAQRLGVGPDQQPRELGNEEERECGQCGRDVHPECGPLPVSQLGAGPEQPREQEPAAPAPATPSGASAGRASSPVRGPRRTGSVPSARRRPPRPPGRSSRPHRACRSTEAAGRSGRGRARPGQRGPGQRQRAGPRGACSVARAADPERDPVCARGLLARRAGRPPLSTLYTHAPAPRRGPRGRSARPDPGGRRAGPRRAAVRPDPGPAPRPSGRARSPPTGCSCTASFDFAGRAAAVPYLARLGVSDLYASPILRAMPGQHPRLRRGRPRRAQPGARRRGGASPRSPTRCGATGWGCCWTWCPTTWASARGTRSGRTCWRTGRPRSTRTSSTSTGSR